MSGNFSIVTSVIDWPVPTPAQLFSTAASIYEGNITGIDARSANSVAATNCRIVAMTAYDLYGYQATLAQELMPDTAQIWLSRHGNIWNVPQLLPKSATGNAIFSGAAGLPIPAGTLLTAPAGWTFLTTSAATVGTGGTVSVPVISALPGSAYNLPGGTPMRLVSGLAGLTAQTAPLDANGAANGTDLESNDSWRSRILLRIRQPPQGGSAADYVEWAQACGVTLVNVVPGAVGAGSVGLYIAAPGPSPASAQLVATLQNYVGAYNTPLGVRPVTARVLVAAAALIPVPVTVALNPDTVQGRAAAIAAMTLFFAQNAQNGTTTSTSGATVYVSRLDNAISTGDGEFSHELILPAGDVTCTPQQILVLGPVDFA